MGQILHICNLTFMGITEGIIWPIAKQSYLLLLFLSGDLGSDNQKLDQLSFHIPGQSVPPNNSVWFDNICSFGAGSYFAVGQHN